MNHGDSRVWDGCAWCGARIEDWVTASKRGTTQFRRAPVCARHRAELIREPLPNVVREREERAAEEWRKQQTMLFDSIAFKRIGRQQVGWWVTE